MPRSVSIRLLTLAGLSSALTLVLAAAAQASASPRPTLPATRATPAAQGAPASKYTSTTFAGYILQAGGPNTVTATFKVPALHCTSADQEITASVGLQGSSTSWSANLLLGCYGGQAHFWPALVANGKETNYTKGADARPGDVVTLTADSSQSKAASVTVTDVTTKTTRKLTGSFDQSNYPWIGDGDWFVNGKEVGVPDFGSFRFYDCAADGNPMSTKFGWLSYNRVTAKGVVQISTGSITSAGFTTTFKHS